jgi:hypothetical protein
MPTTPTLNAQPKTKNAKYLAIAFPLRYPSRLHQGSGYGCDDRHKTPLCIPPRCPDYPPQKNERFRRLLTAYIAGMCGRATYKLTWEEIVALYRLTLGQPAVNTRARYNVCPTTTIDTIEI